MLVAPILYDLSKFSALNIFIDGKSLESFCASTKKQFEEKWAAMDIEKVNRFSMKLLLKELLPVRIFRSKNEKLVRGELERSVVCDAVWRLSSFDKFRKLFLNMEQFGLFYSSFVNLDEAERGFLLKFRNAMAIANEIITPHHSKCLLIDVCARFEGSKIRYITGGGQTKATQRRADMFHCITGLPLLPRHNKSTEGFHDDSDDYFRQKRPRNDSMGSELSFLTESDVFSEEETELFPELENEVIFQPLKRTAYELKTETSFTSTTSECSISVSMTAESLQSAHNFEDDLDFLMDIFIKEQEEFYTSHTMFLTENM